MSSNIPSPSPSRGRLARASTSSRIPPPRRETSIPTPRRTSRTPTDSALPSTPRRNSSIPTTRRSSRTPIDPSTPPLHTPRRAAARLSTAACTPSSRAPRRDDDSAAARLSAGKPARRISSAADASLPTPKRTAGAVFRRVSSAQEENRNRPATPRFARAGTAETPPSRRATPRDRGLPDRGTTLLAAPSPSRRQTTVAPDGGARQQLKASPYARRSSAGGAGRGAVSPGVSRKLNMAPADEEETASSGKRLLGLSPAARRVSGSRGEVGRGGVADRVGVRSNVAARGNAKDRGFMADRVERRRDSGGGKRPGVSALESFRAARRASAEHAEAEAEEKRKADKLDMKPKPVSASSGTGAVATAAASMEKKETLPDRPDPIIPTATMTPQRRTPAKSFRRTSGRFSDADVCLDNVERLRSSLGRRRSHSANDGEAPETPKLRRTSLTSSFAKKEDENKDVNMSENDVPNVEMEIKITPGLAPRSPLKSIGTNRGKVLGTANPNPPLEKSTSGEVNPKRLSFVPQLDDDDAWANEDVEDLGIW